MKAVSDAFTAEYGRKPEVTVRAPGRFHIIGEHSWFFKDKTMSMAVNLPVYVAASRRDDAALRFNFVQLGERKRATLMSNKFRREDRWANAVKAVIYGYQSGGFGLGGMDIMIFSGILPSAGFGITTAIKAASAVAFRLLFDIQCTDSQLLQVIERGNRRFLQMNNNIADNYAALFSKKGNIIITDHSLSSWDYVPLDFAGKTAVLVDTKVPHVSVWNESSIFEPQYALMLGDLRERKNGVYGGWQYISSSADINEELSEVSEDVRRKLLCIMYEHNDLLEAAGGLERRDFFSFARAVNHSHRSMRDLYNISCPEIDWLLKRINELEPNIDSIRNPVSCGRITGKGFGRCLYAFMRDGDIVKFERKLSEFEKIFGFHPEYYRVEPADGACAVVS